MMKTTETGNNKFIKQIGGTTYIVRFHYSEQARETMQEKINRMLQNEVRQSEIINNNKDNNINYLTTGCSSYQVN